MAQQRHRRRGVQPVPGDVADHQQHAPLVDRDHVVPVAADVDPRRGRHVARAHPQSAEPRQRVGQQRVLERLRDAALLGVQLVVLGGHAVEHAAQLLGVLAAPREPVGHQRPRQAEISTPTTTMIHGRLAKNDAAERAVRSDDQRERAVAERHRRCDAWRPLIGNRCRLVTSRSARRA